MKGECSCYMEYPNVLHKKRTGKWLCVDKYECVRALERKPDGTVKRKTKCMKRDINSAETPPR